MRFIRALSRCGRFRAAARIAGVAETTVRTEMWRDQGFYEACMGALYASGVVTVEEFVRLRVAPERYLAPRRAAEAHALSCACAAAPGEDRTRSKRQASWGSLPVEHPAPPASRRGAGSSRASGPPTPPTQPLTRQEPRP